MNAMTEVKSEVLFDRLGGSPGISALVDDIVSMHMQNPTIAARFQPYLAVPDKLQVVKQHLCAFLEAGSGGRAAYQGRGMREAHRGMNISVAEYFAAVDDIMTALRKHGIDDQAQKDVLAIAYSLKGDIVQV
jgi:hemoglobin